MNKFLSLMACALVGFSASAAVTSLYVAGPSTTTVNGVTLGNWDIVNTVEVTVNRGKFTLNCENMDLIAISDKKLSVESWGDWMTGLWAPATPITEADLGKAVALAGPGNANFQVPWKGDWKLEIAQDLSTVTVTTTTPKPETTYHLVGDFSWSPIDKYKFEKETDTVYWLDITEALPATKYLNIMRNSSWNEWWAPTVAPIVAGETAVEWMWQTNHGGDAEAVPDGSNYTGSIRLETPAEITTGCSVQVTFYPTIREHNSGVADAMVEEQNVKAEYFNLQGVKILNPQSGQLYIVRRGASVSKEIAK